MARSVVGPFAMEAPLGIDPRRSSIFRAVHMQQKKAAAVRIFSTPMGLTPEAKRDFATQIEELKELRHPGIVRCYGGGFDKKDAYLAYEFIDGESIDVLLKRRERLPWETAIDYALQLAETLQYAHGSGWLHNRLRADKVMVCAGGLEVKILDFRKSDDSLWMGPAPITATQRIYAAPECQDDSLPMQSDRSDVYSLGVLLYEMLTGHLPFDPSVSEQLLAAQIQQTVPQNVSAIALDCPVWLSTLVAQMLDKDPLKRPFTMAATAMALNQALSRAAGGVSVAEHVASGFNPLQIKGDRKEAEKALGKKSVKKVVENPLFGLINGTALLIAGLIVAFAAIFWVISPASEKVLRERAEAMLVDADLADMNYAMDNYLAPLVKRFPDGPNAQWAKEQIEEIEISNLDRKIAIALRFDRSLKADDEQQLADAIKTEEGGNKTKALEQYRAIITLLDNDAEHKRVVGLAQRRLDKLEKEAEIPDELEAKLAEKMAQAEVAFNANKIADARAIWESIISLYKDNPNVKAIVEKAEARLSSLSSENSDNTPPPNAAESEPSHER
jgi:eukaryotic-like serine/threonine-protein kinase